MFHAQRGVRVGISVALLTVANTCPAAAGEVGRSYVAGYEVQTSAGIVRTSETLRVSQKNATPFVSVSSASGALVSLPTELAADGEIVANSFDPSVTCYNMARAAVFAADRAPTAPAAIYIRFGDDTVAVPLALESTSTTAGHRILAGSGATAFTLSNDSSRIPGGMVVDARIDVVDGQLSEVIFNEATLVGSPARPVSRMTCSLKKAAVPALPIAVLPG